MKKIKLKESIITTLIATILLVSLSCNPRENKLQAITDRLVIIGLDGISVDGLKEATTPHLDQLFENGTLSLSTRIVMPSVTLPNWTSHLTSSGPEQHGVLNNRWTLDNIALPAIVTDSNGYYPSIFKIMKDYNPSSKIAYYYNWAELINSMNPKYMDEISFEEEDSYQDNYAKAFQFIKSNHSDPTLVFLYSVHVDHAGHNYGWMSEEYIKSIEEVDIEIGKFVDNMKSEGLYEDTHFMFFTDHGGHPEYGHGRNSSLEMETPWALTGPHVKKQLMLEPNNSINTAVTIAHLFGCDNIPEQWIGQVPLSIFE